MLCLIFMNYISKRKSENTYQPNTTRKTSNLSDVQEKQREFNFTLIAKVIRIKQVYHEKEVKK